ncbi:histamine H2 receptor-like [Stylophora pistillata]|uniref:histamine H2 receptor-like n=1 Tax=Stylophora pistillata TaxID=50429 RepID=UPI000C049124|nr:histamine H2 receptor-like [Stylophora pistillata]
MNLSDDAVRTICFNLNAADFKIGDFFHWYIANCVAGTLLAIASTLENFCILLTVWKTPILSTPSYVILFSLALSDLGVGLLSQPLAVIYTVAKIQGLIRMACVAGAAVASLSIYLCGVSLLCVTAVSIDRYLSLYLHLRYKQLVTNIRVTVLLVLVWLFAAFSLLTWPWYPFVITPIAIVVGSLCILITSGCFFRIYLVLRYHNTKMRHNIRSSAEQTTQNTHDSAAHFKRSVTGMFLVYIILLFCYLPYLCIASVIAVRGTDATKRLIFELAKTLVYANSAINPLIYCWRLQDLRTAIKQRFPCLWRE